jgi:hypothetical protein
MGRTLIIFGIVIVLVGLLMSAGPRIPLLGKLGRLPGDISVERPGFRFYFPLTTSLILSAILTIALYLFRRR